jgi:hypothetical protein
MGENVVVIEDDQKKVPGLWKHKGRKRRRG